MSPDLWGPYSETLVRYNFQAMESCTEWPWIKYRRVLEGSLRLTPIYLHLYTLQLITPFANLVLTMHPGLYLLLYFKISNIQWPPLPQCPPCLNPLLQSLAERDQWENSRMSLKAAGLHIVTKCKSWKVNRKRAKASEKYKVLVKTKTGLQECTRLPQLAVILLFISAVLNHRRAFKGPSSSHSNYRTNSILLSVFARSSAWQNSLSSQPSFRISISSCFCSSYFRPNLIPFWPTPPDPSRPKTYKTVNC